MGQASHMGQAAMLFRVPGFYQHPKVNELIYSYV